jgi:aryl sulfotransferase
VRWIERDSDPRQALDSPPGVMWHLRDAWQRRNEPSVLLVHYDDLLTDLGSETRRIAVWLGIDVVAGRWPALVEAAWVRVTARWKPEVIADHVGRATPVPLPPR